LAQGGTGPITIYGPDGVEAWLKATLRAAGMRFGFPVQVQAIRPGLVCTDGEFTVEAAPVRHRIEAYAYAICEAEQAGRFDVEAARALGIPPGPLYGRLKAGETVTLDDGRVVEGTTLVGPSRPGRKLVLSGDTGPSTELVALAHGADLLVHESTYAEPDRALADRAAHATATIAAEVAREAKVRMLILTHFSARYESGEAELNLESLLAEARAIFPETRLAYDLLRVSVSRQGD